MTKTISVSITTALAAAVLVTMSLPALAMERTPAQTPSGKTVMVPDHAIQKAPGLYYLGEALDEDSDSIVEGYMIVHPRSGNKKPDGAGKPGGNGDNSSPTASCYGFLGSGAKWKVQEDWVVNPSNDYGIADQTIMDLLRGGIDKWEDAVDGAMDGIETTIFGTGYSTTSAIVADTAGTDGLNEVHFGDLDAGTIGVTIIWGRFSGPARFRELVEWDQVYNTDYEWSAEANGVAGKFDFDSIATHELGHALGLDDLYIATCADMTMYGYGSYAETKARTLEDGDINGMSALY